MKLRHYAALSLILIIGVSLLALGQANLIPMPNNNFLVSQTITGAQRRLIGFNTSNVVSIDPDGNSALGIGAYTVTFPAANISVPGTVFTSCANSLSCATPVNTSSSVKFAYGTGALTSATPSLAHVTAISPAFTDTSHMFCTAVPVGTTAAIAAAGVAVNLVSASAFDVTGPNTVTTVFFWQCVGT
jgi:hypothetical protein